ncbi:MAG TPA: LuxR family transcriptional regulator [Acidothermaceae bacterium]|nr:LuxR family transcriptional regulator [Acidothermaceae bacterium]
MDAPTALSATAAELLDKAREHGSSGRAARTLTGGADRMLRQTLIGILAGATLDEHENPGEATLQVLSGRVVLRTSTDETTLTAGTHVAIPDSRHSVEALENSAILITVAMHL